MVLADGQLFAGYTIIQRLGAGAMGEVYLAQHPRLPRRDALKVLPVEFTTDNEYRMRFLREADVAATLMHPHIVGVHDRGEFGGQLWLSMDYIEGTDAGHLLADHYIHGLPPDEVVRIVAAVADALDYAHDRQLLHRDVKPANILLTEPDDARQRVFLADFGIARRIDDATGLTGTSMTVGTVAYAAPEQLRGEAIDGRADQYALAASAFHLLTGTTLFQHANQAAVISQHLTAPPPAIGDRRPELSGLDPVLCKALAKAPDDRYESCQAFADALGRQIGAIATDLGADEATLAARAALRDRHRKPKPKPRLRPAVLVPAILAVLLIAVAAIVLTVIAGRHARSTAHPASPAPGATTPVLPVVRIGADCAVLGAAGVSPTGVPAYCAQLPTSGDTMWSVYKSQIPVPPETPGPTDQVYPPSVEEQVRVCVDETGQTRAKCLRDVQGGAQSAPT